MQTLILLSFPHLVMQELFKPYYSYLNDLGLQSSVLALDESVIDVDQVDNLIKFCPTKEESELVKVFLFLVLI